MKEGFQNNPNYFEDGLENLKIITSCPICNLKYSSAEIRVIEERNDAHLVYIKCGRCQSSILAIVTANQLGVSSVGILTDLSGEDILKFKKQPAVSTNDVIDMHQLLKSKSLSDYINF